MRIKRNLILASALSGCTTACQCFDLHDHTMSNRQELFPVVPELSLLLLEHYKNVLSLIGYFDILVTKLGHQKRLDNIFTQYKIRP